MVKKTQNNVGRIRLTHAYQHFEREGIYTLTTEPHHKHTRQPCPSVSSWLASLLLMTFVLCLPCQTFAEVTFLTQTALAHGEAADHRMNLPSTPQTQTSPFIDQPRVPRCSAAQRALAQSWMRNGLAADYHLNIL